MDRGLRSANPPADDWIYRRAWSSVDGSVLTLILALSVQMHFCTRRQAVCRRPCFCITSGQRQSLNGTLQIIGDLVSKRYEAWASQSHPSILPDLPATRCVAWLNHTFVRTGVNVQLAIGHQLFVLKRSFSRACLTSESALAGEKTAGSSHARRNLGISRSPVLAIRSGKLVLQCHSATVPTVCDRILPSRASALVFLEY